MGPKGDAIREYFLQYNEALFNDFVLEANSLGSHVELLARDLSDWRITFAETGMRATIGERLKAVEPYLEGESEFLAAYGDAVTDASLDQLIARFRATGQIAMFLSVRPQFSAHIVTTSLEGVVSSLEDMARSDVRINGGFFACKRELLDWIEPGDELVGAS